jgi:cytochrome c oxidase assembly protein subunit 15
VHRRGIGPPAFLRISQVTLVLVVVNIVTGAAVRLTDSGLGCPDWPTCSQRRLTPPLSLHPAVEFGNRMIVVALCACTVVAFAAAWTRSPRRRELVWLSGGLVVGVLGEAVLGGVVVYTKLNPYVVMTHFMVGIALLTDAVVLALRAGREPRAASTALTLKVPRRDLWTSRLMLALLAVAVALGAATTAAGPHAGGKGAKRLPVALADMARAHSSVVLVLVGVTLFLLYLLHCDGAPPSVTDRARLLLAALVVQGLIGYTQYFTHLPAVLVGVHVLGATVVWTAMLCFHDGLTHDGVGESRPSMPPAAGGVDTEADPPIPAPAASAAPRQDGTTAPVPS